MPTTCETCERNDSIAVACVPGVPYSAGYCLECLKVNAHPWFILVSATASCGGLDKMIPEWREMVDCTCLRLGKTLDQFNADVAQAEKDMEEYQP